MSLFTSLLAVVLLAGTVAEAGSAKQNGTALRKSVVQVAANGAATATCGPLDAPENAQCKEVVEWAAGGGKWDTKAGSWYRNMPNIAGVKHDQATLADVQRLYYCAPPGKDLRKRL